MNPQPPPSSPASLLALPKLQHWLLPPGCCQHSVHMIAQLAQSPIHQFHGSFTYKAIQGSQWFLEKFPQVPAKRSLRTTFPWMPCTPDLHLFYPPTSWFPSWDLRSHRTLLRFFLVISLVGWKTVEGGVGKRVQWRKGGYGALCSIPVLCLRHEVFLIHFDLVRFGLLHCQRGSLVYRNFSVISWRNSGCSYGD